MKNDNSIHLTLARKISEQFKLIPQVDAAALGGSLVKGFTDKFSDIDLYVFSSEIIPLHFRQTIVTQLGSKQANLDLNFWDLGDEWIDKETGIEVDVIYWNKAWIEEQIDRVLVVQQASVGYSTCFWHTILNSISLFDRDDWFYKLQEKSKLTYPEKLKNAIIAKNHPVLRSVIPSYYYQIQKAIERNDLISVNHRIAALLASYFDVLFALNYLPNPGEKKVLRFALENCLKKPMDLKEQVERVLCPTSFRSEILLNNLTDLLDNLDRLLLEEGINPSKTFTLDRLS